MTLMEQPSDPTTAATSTVSGLRASAPGFVTTATFPNSTTASSTNTASGQSSAGGTSIVSQPAPCRASTYACHCCCASATSTAARSMCVTMPSARRGPGRRTSARPAPRVLRISDVSAGVCIDLCEVAWHLDRNLDQAETLTTSLEEAVQRHADHQQQHRLVDGEVAGCERHPHREHRAEH